VDDVRAALVTLVEDVRGSTLPSQVVHEVGRRILDTIGIAIAGWDEAPSRAVRAFADMTPIADGPHATVWGTGTRVAPEVAAFANGTMMHSQDFMDTYLSPSGEACHPADLIPGLIALAEYTGRPPSDLVSAIVVGYEVVCRLSDAAQIRGRGWDHATYNGIAAACAGAALLGLDRDGIGHAISLATVPNVALRQTRNGELTMWKACAPANAVHNAVRAARMAALGIEGPGEPFTGINGFERRVSGPLERAALTRTDRDDFAILRTHIKFHAVQYNAQAGIDAALAVRDRLEGSLADDPIASVHLTMSEVCHQFTADSPNKWDPQTRETADHSLPYLVATALRDGRIGHDDFGARDLRDPERLADTQKVTVAVDPAMTAAYPQRLTVRVDVEQRSGTRTSEQVDHPIGHALRPMTDAQVAEKFRRLTAGRLDAHAIERIVRDTLDLANLADLGATVATIRLAKMAENVANFSS